MNTCKSCKHWSSDDCEEGGLSHPYDMDTGELMKMPFEVRECVHPELMFCERPLRPDGFSVEDGSGYRASLYTAEAFGCVLHEEATEPPAPAKSP